MNLKWVREIGKALSDESRLRLLMALTDGELCQHQLRRLIGLAPSTISNHLGILHQAGLVSCRKQGRWVYYSLAFDDSPEPVPKVLNWVQMNLAHTPKIIEDKKFIDAQKLAAILPLTKPRSPILAATSGVLT